MTKTKSIFLLLTLIIAVSPISMAQTPMTVEQTVMHREQERVQALVSGDFATLGSIFADDLVYTHSNGRQDTKQQFLDSLKSGSTKYEAMKHSDLKVQVFGDTAVLRGKSDVKAVSNGQSLAILLRFIAVYVKKGGQWQMTTWQSTRADQQ